MAPHAGVRRSIQLKPDQALLLVTEAHSVTVKRAHGVNPVLLHESNRRLAHIIGTPKRPDLGDTNGVVGLDPLRSESAGVVGVGVVDILGLADEELAAGELENIEVLHLD